MKSIKLFHIITIATILVTLTESDDSVIEARMEQFEAMIQEHEHMIQEQQTLIRDLHQRIIEVDNERSSIGYTFDCYRTDSWYDDGIITFNGCSVDTTTSDPWRGNFTVQDSGIYQFTFEGAVAFLPGSDRPFGFVALHVDDEAVASGYVVEKSESSGDVRIFMVSIDTFQELEAGQIVSIQWANSEGAYLYSNINTHVHFTGHKLASATLVPPQCEYTGQTFQYPGSCRKYYLCLADGTMELGDCCPDVFDPAGEVCVPEEDGSHLCNDVDAC